MLLRNCAAALLLHSAVSSAIGYGPVGHEIVGAIADCKLAGTTTEQKVRALLDNASLAHVSVWADDIKSWDKNGPEDPRGIHFPEHPKIEEQLRDFWKANPPAPEASASVPSHHWFHYTDVPVFERYSEGKRGRGNWDVVHAISFCIAVLGGEVPQDNPRKITRPVALILLAHLLADIHQPLHVGAEYFDQTGAPADPKQNPAAIGDEGGNSLSFVENATAQHARHYYHSFHAYWDLDLPRNLVIGTSDELSKFQGDALYEAAKAKLIAELCAKTPRNWQSSGEPKVWAERWADEILPIAREAHQRVRFQHIHREEKEGRIFAKGDAVEIGTGYREWGTKVVRDELHKAGWRLADLLEKIFSPYQN
jgi:hypothetical protein